VVTRSVLMRNGYFSFSKPVCLLASVLALILAVPTTAVINTSEHARAEAHPLEKQKVIIDTDIGDDIDDAFAVALALDSPELDILGFTTTTGNTIARALILNRMLAESGRASILVGIGKPPNGLPADGGIGSQRAYGEDGPPSRRSYPDASALILEEIRKYPGEVTLIAIGPLTNIGVAIDSDPQTFRKLKRLVMMGGWMADADDGFGRLLPPEPEYNIVQDVSAAQKLFQSGVNISVMPVDSTLHLLLDEEMRKRIFSQATGLTNSLRTLYVLWGRDTPVLFDAMAVGFAMNPQLCPVQPMQIIVDSKGLTQAGSGSPNAQICLRSDPSKFFNYYLDRVASPRDLGAH
jgi:purine nucleosidase